MHRRSEMIAVQWLVRRLPHLHSYIHTYINTWSRDWVIAFTKQCYWADRLSTFADEDDSIMGLWKKLWCWRVQGDREVTQPIPDTCYIFQKINYIEIRKQKRILEVSTAFSSAYIHSFPHVWCNPLKSVYSDVYHRNGLPDKKLSIYLAQENQEMYP
jgi:hypothetical protein